MKSVLVGLDLTEMDAHLIEYASVICRTFQIKDIYFIHVARNLELPEEIIKNYNEVLVTIDEGIESNILKKLDEHLNCGPEVKVHVEVREGNAVEKILRFAKIKNIDLIMLGRKKELRGSGVVTHSITRKSPCHLLLIPDVNSRNALHKILVPVDFSKHSAIALNQAVEMGKKQNATVSCVNVYEVPIGYSKAGKTYEEFTEIMLGHAKNDFAKFIEGIDYSVDCHYLLTDDDHVEAMLKLIEEFKADIVFLGSKGRTNASVILLGSMAEKLTRQISDTPLYIVKQKGENLGFFEALLKI